MLGFFQFSQHIPKNLTTHEFGTGSKEIGLPLLSADGAFLSRLYRMEIMME